MKTFVTTILLSLSIGLFFSVDAQVTAVMQAKVTIVSGAGFSSVQEANINLDHLKEDVETGSFSLVAAPGSDINVHIVQQSEIKNGRGEVIEFHSFSVNKTATDSGDHHVTVNGKLKDQQHLLNGHYQGAVTAVVEYL